MNDKLIPICGGRRFRRELKDISNRRVDGSIKGLVKSSGQCGERDKMRKGKMIIVSFNS